MNSENYFDLEVAVRNGYIYRIIPKERLFQLFANKQNVLVKTKKWDDPFENFILNARLKLPTGEHATVGFRNQFYGQCWTLHKASDAMWRIYSPKADAVRIRSTIRKVAESLSSQCGDRAPHEVFIGKVRYLANKELISFANRALSSDTGSPSMRMLAQTLFVKRPAFRDEREVRLLFIPHENADAKDDLFRYPVDPHGLIDQVMIDPRLGLADAKALKQKIRAQTGFAGEIKRSLLYAPPPELTIRCQCELPFLTGPFPARA